MQQQVGYLQNSTTDNEERYTRAKADNAALQARVIMLEEQLRDVEMRYEDRLQVSIQVFNNTTNIQLCNNSNMNYTIIEF